MSFSNLGLSAPLLRAIAERAYTEATPIQTVAIPAVLAFNYLSTAITADESKLSRAAGEMLDNIEAWDQVETAGARRGRVA